MLIFWKDVQIDPESIQLLMLSHPETVRLMHVKYPSDENALVWEIYSPTACDEKVRVCYLLQGMDHLIRYRLFVNEKETIARLQTSVIVRNFSGEKFPFASLWLGYGPMIPIALDQGETRKIVLSKVDNIPVEKRWEWDAHKAPWKNNYSRASQGIPVYYTLENISKNGLGQHVLSSGKVRIFQEKKDRQPILLGEDHTEAVPVGETMKICVAQSFDISVDQRVMEKRKVNIRNNNKNRIVLYDTEEHIVAKLQNFKAKPAKISMIQHIQGQWEIIETSTPFTLESASKLVFDIPLAPLEKKSLSLRFSRRNIRP